jgi:hypothetical protein
MSRLTRAASAALAVAAFATAIPAAAQSRPVVVELFTSQGCSSCPPADRLLAELAARPGVLALGFHVDYWDRLGWRDRFSSPAATERQNFYATLFHRREVYTPQMVVDGTGELVGSHRSEVLGAVEAARPAATAPIAFAADRRSVTVGSGAGGGHILLVRFELRRLTDVAAGENAGRTAEDIDVVQKLVSLGDWTGTPLSFAVDPPGDNEGLAVLVQGAGGNMLGAASITG